MAHALSLSLSQPKSDPECSSQYISTLRSEWRQVFIIAAEIYITGAILYTILASGKTQAWATCKDDDVITTSPSNMDPDNVDETDPLLSESKPNGGVNYSIT